MNIDCFIEHIHRGQKRKTGEPYTSHLYAVREILIQAGVQDKTTLIAALLHDSLEDTQISKEYLMSKYGNKIAKIVEIVSKDSAWNTAYCKMKSNLHVMEHIASKYPEAILIKMADRLHNLYTLEGFLEEKQTEYLEETKGLLIPMFKRILDQEKSKKIKKYMQSLLQKLLQETNKHLLYKINENSRVVEEEYNLFDLQSKKPGIMTYEGWEGIEKVYLEVLMEAQKTGEKILAFESGVDIKNIDKSFIDRYISKRLENKITAYVITPDAPEDRKYKKTHDGNYTFIRLIPNFSLGANINIVGDLVMSFTVSPLQGTLRRDREEAKSFKSIFYKLWEINQ